jgi:hypothetical protein
MEQKALVKWLNLHPLLKNYFCKNDNEGPRKTIVRDDKVVPVGLYNAMGMGLRPGVSDIFIYWPTKTYHGLWLEVKRKKKYSPSEMNTDTWKAQEVFQMHVKSVGYMAEFCFGWEDGKRIIENYLLS